MIELVMQAEPTVNMAKDIISSLGFPIFVAVWLLWKSHKDTSLMSEAINKLENAMLELSTYIKTLHNRGDL